MMIAPRQCLPSARRVMSRFSNRSFRSSAFRSYPAVSMSFGARASLRNRHEGPSIWIRTRGDPERVGSWLAPAGANQAGPPAPFQAAGGKLGGTTCIVALVRQGFRAPGADSLGSCPSLGVTRGRTSYVHLVVAVARAHAIAARQLGLHHPRVAKIQLGSLIQATLELVLSEAGLGLVSHTAIRQANQSVMKYIARKTIKLGYSPHSYSTKSPTI
jgi:hypothetical protein